MISTVPTSPTGSPRRAAVLGHPIAHALSPVLHLSAYQQLGLSTWRYERIDCDESALPGFLDSAGPEWVGLSLTRPLKRLALHLAEDVSALAEAVGAANTLLFTGAGCRAENTDVVGIVRALQAVGITSVGSALVLGAGGTAQAALAALRELGECAPTVVVRDVARTAELRAAADRLGVQPRVVAGLLSAPLPDAELIISTLPRGAADSVRLGGVRTVLDAVYAPWPTDLAAAAHRAGATVVSGLAMLLYQAAAQVELMTGQPAPVDVMRTAVDQAQAPC